MSARARLARHIEVIGIPGAGKTTLLERLASQWKRRGEAAVRLLPPADPGGVAAMAAAASLSAALLARAPAIWARLLATADGRWLVTKIGYRMAALAQRRAEAAGSIVQDAGVLQPLVSFPAEFRRDRSIGTPTASLLASLPLPAGLIHVKAPAELAFSRYTCRQQETGRRAEVQANLADFAESSEVCEAVAAACREAGTQVLAVPADHAGDLDEIAARIITLVTEVQACPGP